MAVGGFHEPLPVTVSKQHAMAARRNHASIIYIAGLPDHTRIYPFYLSRRPALTFEPAGSQAPRAIPSEMPRYFWFCAAVTRLGQVP
jgi:hypothetical protein